MKDYSATFVSCLLQGNW